MRGRAPTIFLPAAEARGPLATPLRAQGARIMVLDPADDSHRLTGLGAGVALIDARGDRADALAGLAGIAEPARIGGAALLVLLDGPDPARIAAAFDAGATHYLAMPFDMAELFQACRFAQRHADRAPGRRRQGAASELRAGPDRDMLTGLADATAARRWLDEAAAQPHGPPAVILLSVDRFEMLNAAFGRSIGDSLLHNTARRIERLGGEDDRCVARMGGAEFMIGLPGPVANDQALFLARALHVAVSRPFAIDDELVTLAVHVGVALGEAGEDGAALYRRASAALAAARSGEGGAVRILSAQDEDVEAHRAQLAVDLRQALSGEEIAIRFQPQIAVASGRIVGVEALARWRHPTLGELGAETLFAAAERSDYVVQLSRHVQRRVVAEVVRWPASLAHLGVAINVTAADMALPGFAEEFCAMLDEGGLARERVTVEVTEGGLIEDLGAAAELLARLRSAGLRVAIDDFGTGYSSLAYLKALPLDYLKIDRHLSQDIVGSVRDRVVVRGVIDMARSLGLTVVAEGVETTRQLGLLAQEGCNLYQGYIFAPPLDGQALTTMVEGWQRGGPASADPARP